MKHSPFRLILTGFSVLALSPLAHATAVLFSQVQQANPTLIHQWDFEGATDATRLLDTAGNAHLQRVTGEFAIGDGGLGNPIEVPLGTPGSVAGQLSDIVFETGFNGGQAYRPYIVNPAVTDRAGAGLTGAGPDFTTPIQFTIEAVLKPAEKTTSEATAAVQYIFQTRPGSDRGYYLIQDKSGLAGGDTEAVGTIVGQSFGNPGLGRRYDTSEPWIYVAAVIDLSPIGATPFNELVTVNFYSANLSAGETTLSLFTKSDFVTNDTLEGVAGIFGIGGFAVDRAALNTPGVPDYIQEMFQGAIDNVAVYNSLLDPQTLQLHLDSLRAEAVPAPTALALVLAGLAAIPVTRRRRVV